MAGGRKVAPVIALGIVAVVAVSGLGGCGGGSAFRAIGDAPDMAAPPAPPEQIPDSQHAPVAEMHPQPAENAETAETAAAAATIATTTAPAPETTPVPATAPAPAAVPAPGGVPGTVRLAFSGDSLWHSPLWAGAQRNFAATHDGAAGYDFAPMLAGLAPLVGAADLGVCHLETPIAPEGEGLSTAPLYGVPAEVATAIAAAGFDRCSTASNHTADRGVAGIDRTVNVLEAAGLGVSGMARNPEEIQPHVFAVNGVAISHLSYTFSYNGLHLPAGQEWRSALLDPTRIIADATQARAMGAELVVVSLHWGVEGEAAVTRSQREIAEQLTASGAIDLIVGHHAHVLQPIEQVNGVWVIYGLGNMISNMPTGPRWPASSQDGAVVTVTFARGVDGGLTATAPVVHPTWCDRDAGWIVRLVQPTLADPATPDGLRGQLERSLERTRSPLGLYVST